MKVEKPSINHIFCDNAQYAIPVGGLAERVRKGLLASSSAVGLWPDDDKFEESWNMPAYNRLSSWMIRIVLQGIDRELARSQMPETVWLGANHVEHLMPQAWEPHWPLPPAAMEAAGVARHAAVHAFGNLTLVNAKLNATLSNAPWSQKRTLLAEHTSSALNRALLARPEWVEVWDEAAISTRGQWLLGVARQVWPYPGTAAGE